MEVNSVTYECWHEVGHAIVCLFLGGDVNCVELLEGHEVGRARAQCVTNNDIRQRVACGGFAAEFVLLRDGDIGKQDEKQITQVIFRNATIDREMYFSLDSGAEFTETQDREFMHCAVDQVSHIIRRYKTVIHNIVSELEKDRYVAGDRIKEIISGT